MRLILAAAAVAGVLTPATAPARTVEVTPSMAPSTAMPNLGALPEQCLKRDRLRVKGRNEAKSGKLGDMPAADQIKTVYRSADGCPDPLVVRHGVGMPR